MEITYPKDIRQKNRAIEKGYEWFVKNRGTNSGKKFASGRTDIKIYKTLPNILDAELGLSYSAQKWQDKDKNTYHKDDYKNNHKNNDKKGNQ